MQSIPAAGEIYISRSDPAVTICIKAVQTIDENEDVGIGAGFFVVRACDPADPNAPFEFTSDEWAEHGFTLSPAPER